jgi:hypothetical protein
MQDSGMDFTVLSMKPNESVVELILLEVAGKCPYVRHPKPGTRPKGGESKRSADKSRGVTAKKRYLRDAYVEVRRSDSPR